MASFASHVAQSRSNLDFLESLNAVSGKWDWKVTVSFYVAVHLMNAHLAEKVNMHFRSHHAVETAISPTSSFVASRLPEDVFVSYMTLSNLSRRARYLCSDDGTQPEQALITYDKHLKKALHHLDVLLTWFSSEYKQQTFLQKPIFCPDMTKDMVHFSVAKIKAAA